MTADGVRALEIYRRRGADLLVTSSHLPLLDGPDLIRALRAHHASLPILLLSSDPTMLQVAEQIGANRFVLKPFTLQELRQALGALVAP
jgi:CheY-like chemotaxis protein